MTKQIAKKPVAIAMGAALTGGLIAAGTASAAANPFALSDIGSGYMQVAEAKCGGQKKVEEAKCGGAKPAPKSSEGKCGGEKKAEEAQCGGAKPAPKSSEGKCGEAKCGSNK